MAIDWKKAKEKAQANDAERYVQAAHDFKSVGGPRALPGGSREAVASLPNLSLQAAKAGLQTGSTPISGAAVDRFFPAAVPSLRDEDALRAEVRTRSGSPAPLPTARPSAGLMLPTGAALQQERAAARRALAAEGAAAQERLSDLQGQYRGALARSGAFFDVPPAGSAANDTPFDVDPATVGRTDGERSALGRAIQGARTDVGRVKYLQRYQDTRRKDTFTGQFAASFDMGQMGQDEAMAWNDYLNDPTQEKRAYAEAVSQARADYTRRNAAALDADASLPWISQSLAGYLPQLKDQTVAGAKGALAGGLIGSAVPGAGTALGAKVGYTAGRAKYGYDTARGAAFKALLDAGVPEDRARAAASDEAVIQSIIEGGDAALDLITLGGAKAISSILGTGAHAAAKEAAGGAGKRLLKALAGYGLNILGEGAQEWTQEGVSIANQGRSSSGLPGLVGATADQIGRAVIGRAPESLAQMNAAGAEGMKIAALAGGGQLLANTAITGTVDRVRTAPDRAIDSAYSAMQEHGLFTPETWAARQQADQKLKLPPRVNGQTALMLPTGREDAPVAPSAAQGGANVRSGTMDTPAPQQAQKTASTGEAESTAVNTDPTRHTPQEQAVINEYQNAVDASLVAFVNKWKTLKNPDYKKRIRMPIAEVSERAAHDVQSATGIDVTGFEHVLSGNALEHIEKRHGASGRADQSMTDVNDIGRMGYVLENYDSVDLLKNDDGMPRTSTEYANADDTPAPMVQFQKKVNGTYYVVEAVPDSAAHQMRVVSAYMHKNGGSTDQVLNVPQNGPQLTPEAPHGANTSATAPIIADSSAGGNTQSAQTGPESSVGAAQMGFDPYSNLQNQKSEFHKDGEKAARQVDVPTTDLNNQRIPKSVATVMESGNITDEAVEEVRRQVADGTLSFTRNTDKGAMSRAEQTVRELGWDGAVERFHQEARRGVVSKDNMALGATLLVNSAQNGDIKTFASLLIDYTSMSRAGAQATQANRLLKKLSPEGQLYGVQRSIGNLQEELNRRYGDDKAPQIAVDPELMAEFTASADQAGRDAAMKKIWQNVADQVPATWKDKWDAWRYLSMLGNPRTHIRNIAGNAAFMPVRLAKDAVAWAGEGIADKMLPGGIKRTKSPLNLASESDRALLRAAFQDAAGQRESILGQGKFNDGPMGQIRDRQTVFGVKPLETVRKANSKALDVEDAWFSTPAYAGALAGYLKANHATLETASPSLLDDARAYAVREAQRATYRDSNALSDFVAGLRYRGKNPVGQGANLLMEGILPFRRTPANILMRGVEYSPVGLVKGLTYDLTQVRNGKLSAAEAIDNIAAGLTGTGLLALGAFMAAQGWVTGGSGDDEQAELDNLTGEQPYAVTIGSHSYTLDWMAPEALPFFVGVELYNNLADNGTRSGRAMNDIISSLSSLTEPMLEMSMLQGLQDAIDSVAYSENKLAGLIASSVTGYLSQGLPTIFGQAERTREDRRETTFVDRTSPLSNDLQRGLGRTMNKLPGDFQQIPYIDGWGRTESSGKLLPRAAENFLAPWYSSQKNVTEADRELQRLLDAGQSGVVAKRTPQNIQVTYKENPEDETNQKRYLNAEEYVTYATVKGQTSYDLVMDMINSAEYRSMTDEQKADAIKLAYTYAGHLAAEEVTGGKHESEEYVDLAQAAKKELGLYEAEYLLLCEKYGKGVMNGDGIREAYQNGIALEDYLTYAGALKSVKADKEAKTGKAPGSTSQVDSARALLRDSSLTDKERAVLWSLEGDVGSEGGWKESNNPFGERAIAIRKQFDLDVETFLDALEIYRVNGKAADKKAALRELVGDDQGNALYSQLGKD
jgi:hypothetical protein